MFQMVTHGATFYKGGQGKGARAGRRGEEGKGSEGIGEGMEGKENGHRPPTIFGLTVALVTQHNSLSESQNTVAITLRADEMTRMFLGGDRRTPENCREK